MKKSKAKDIVRKNAAEIHELTDLMNQALYSFIYSMDESNWFVESLRKSGVHNELYKHLSETMTTIDGLRDFLDEKIYKDGNGVDLSFSYRENLKKERHEKICEMPF